MKKRFVSLVLALVQVAMTLYIPILVGNAIDCIIEAGRVDFDTMAHYLGQVVICTAAAAAAPLARVSASGIPGSRKCTCTSRNPLNLR